MKIQFTKSPQALGFGYFEGNQVDLPEKQAQEFIRLKYAEQVGTKKGRPEQGLPRSFPHRDLFDKLGFDTVEQVKEVAEELEQLSGITEKIALEVLEYIFPKQPEKPKEEKAIAPPKGEKAVAKKSK